jgi:capsule polysaccharide export protein KpsE/RkpR
VVDDKGNPTPTFLQKALLGVKNLLHKDTNAEDNNQQMSKPVYALMATLCANALVVDDKGQVTLSAEQAKTVEDRLAELEKKDKESTAAMNAAVPAIDKLKAKLNDLEKDVKAKDEQIKNMQAAPGAVTDQGPKKEGQEASFTPEDIWNCIKDI